MKKITKAVIAAAGYGTRLLPITKTIPKEMLPIGNIPAIHYIVQEIIDAGIKDILVIISKDKKAIVDYFRQDKNLEKYLKSKNKIELLNKINNLHKMAKINFVYQKKMLGIANAVSYAKSFTKNEPFALLLADLISLNYKTSPIKQCINAYYKTGRCVIGVSPVLWSEIDKYGIVVPISKINNSTFLIKEMVEKPQIGTVKSNFGIWGKYVLTPNIYEYIKKTKKDINGEFQITDSLSLLHKDFQMVGCIIDGNTYDVGCLTGLIKANAGIPKHIGRLNRRK